MTLTAVSPARAEKAETFTAYARSFTIKHRRDGMVAEPFIGAYGKPPWIGGIDNPHEDELVGPVVPAEKYTVTPPICSNTTSAPGEHAVELVLGLSAGSTGALVDGAVVDYAADGQPYRTTIDVRITMCGSEVTDPDCGVGT